MKYGLWRALIWVLLYLVLALLPLVLALAFNPPPARTIGIEIGAKLGMLALGILSMQAVISGRQPWFASGAGMDNLLQIHRQIGIFALMLILAHPITLFFANPDYLAYLDPRVDWLRATSLIFIFTALLILVVSSLWRATLGMSYEWWRAIHGGLALLVVGGGLVHGLLVDHYTDPLWKKVVLTTMVGFALCLLVDTRLLRPLKMRRRPWRVAEVVEERGDSTTLVLDAEGHRGMKFRPGQFAWLTLGNTPFSLQQHPFSICSSAAQKDRLSFTAKALGDFTSSWKSVRPGTRAWLEGPYGIFVHDAASKRSAVYIAGGIGITPIMSMLRTHRDLGADFPLWLIYANKNETAIIFREELDALAATLPLTLVHVLSDPSDEWEGETGYVDADLLDRHLPEDDGAIEYFLCGPSPMMNIVEPELIARDVEMTRIYSERFNLV
ncbi:MAG: ferredoxin reductase family protein [Methylohalobius sp. ZOD2]